MVVEKRGFFFRNFEKILCAAVALAFIVAVLYVVRKNRAAELNEVLGSIEDSITILRRGSDPPPPDAERARVYLEEWDGKQVVERPEEVREAFWPAFPRHYPELVVGTGREYQVQFDDPIEKQSVQIETVDGEYLVVEGALEHPVHGDFSRVSIHTGPGEGVFRIIARGGGRTHIRDIITDRSIDVPPSPPARVWAMAERGAVEINFLSNPENHEGVVVEGYEIFRKRARDLTADFELADRLSVYSEELSDEARRALREAGIIPVEKHPERRRRAPEAPEDDTVRYRWRDNEARPDEIYLYKIRTIGLKSSPRRSGFTETLRVETMPVIDFRFTAVIADELNFEVVAEAGERRIESGPARGGDAAEMLKEQLIAFDMGFIRDELPDDVRRLQRLVRAAEAGFRLEERNHVVADRIGAPVNLTLPSGGNGIPEDEAEEDVSLATGCILLDFHRDALRRRPYSTGRIIYIDRKGEISSRWRTYWGAEHNDDYPWEPSRIVEVETREPEREWDRPMDFPPEFMEPMR